MVRLRACLFRHRGSKSVAKLFAWVETRIERLVWLAEDMNEQHHLPVLHFPDSHFDFRDLTSADVPPGYLKLPRQPGLSPAAIASDAPDLPTDDVLMHHAAGKDSIAVPMRRAAVRIRHLAGGLFAMFPGTINAECSCRTNAAFMVNRLFRRWQPEQRGPLKKGPALAAEVVSNCGDSWGQLFKSPETNGSFRRAIARGYSLLSNSISRSSASLKS